MKKFKDYEQVKATNGWAKMYYCFDDLERHDSSMMLCYLIDTEGATRKCREKGYEDYWVYEDYIIDGYLHNYTNYLINQTLDDLKAHGYISTHNIGHSKGKRAIKLNHDVIADAIGVSKSDSNDVSKSDSKSDSKDLKHNRLTDEHTNTQTDEQEKEAKASTSSKKRNNDEFLEQEYEVIDYFNLVMNTNYRKTSTCSFRKILKKLFEDGYTKEDMKSVIDKKYADWKNTKFESVLRPETLFGEKFESYLNQRNYVSPQKEVRRTVINKDNLRAL